MASPALRSALYEGVVTHRRTDPEHQFTQRVTIPLLFTDELAEVSRIHPLVHVDPARPARRLHVIRLVRADFLAPHDVPIDRAVAHEVEAAGGTAAGPVAVLGHVRTWGWLFNPLTLYYCFDERGHHVRRTVLEVSNTPWRERHSYVVGPPGGHRVTKAMHVSPFLPMGAEYHVRYSPPGALLTVNIDVIGTEGGEQLLSAAMHLRRRALDRRALDRLLWRTPAMTLRVSAGIYWRAAQVLARGAAVHPHPQDRFPAVAGRPHG